MFSMCAVRPVSLAAFIGASAEVAVDAAGVLGASFLTFNGAPVEEALVAAGVAGMTWRRM